MVYTREQLDEFKWYLGIGPSKSGWAHGTPDCAVEPNREAIATAKECIYRALCAADPRLTAKCPIRLDNIANAVIIFYFVHDLEYLAFEEGHSRQPVIWAIYNLIEEGALWTNIVAIPPGGTTWITPEPSPNNPNKFWSDEELAEVADFVDQSSGLPPGGMGLVVAAKPDHRDERLTSLVEAAKRCSDVHTGADTPIRHKRSTTRGQAGTLILAKLSEHHGYNKDEEIVTNESPIGVRILARSLGKDEWNRNLVSAGSVSEFFKKHFGDHTAYASTCSNHEIGKKLKAISGEYVPCSTYGTDPERDDDNE